MNKLKTFFLCFVAFILITNCSNTNSKIACQNNCTKNNNICFIVIFNTQSPTTNSLACETIKNTCIHSCGQSSSGSKSSSSSRSKSSTISSSSGGSKSTGSSSSSSSSSSGGGSSGSGGSSHSIVADAEN